MSTSPSRKQAHNSLRAARKEVGGAQGKGVAKDVAYVAQGELASMKSLASGRAPATAPTEAAASFSAAPNASMAGSYGANSSIAQSRKERIKQIDSERKAQGSRKEDWEEADEQKRTFLLAKAGKQLMEDEDEVKDMNTLMSYAKTVAVRDAQILEKQSLEKEKAEEERRMDRMMEIERQKAQKLYQEREKKRAEDRRRGAQVIKAQMEEREQERLRQLELKYNEQQAMVRHMEALKEEEQRRNEEKKLQARRVQQEVAVANVAQIKSKLQQQQMEREEEKRIQEWLKQKDAKDLEAAREAERQRAEREREIARLRSLQEKVQDEKSLQAELLARRQQEARDREWRAKEASDAEKKAKMNRELQEAREAQLREKEERMLSVAYEEAQDFERLKEHALARDAFETQRRLAESGKKSGFKDGIKEQIMERQELVKKERRAALEEGQMLRTQEEERHRKLQRVKEQKLAQLEAAEVPGKYTSVLARKDVAASTRFRKK